MIWHVYLLSCRDGALYCGITTNLERRMAQHNGALAGGARFTSGRRPAKLLASVACDDKSQALKLEARVKGQPRGKKLAFLERFKNENALAAALPDAGCEAASAICLRVKGRNRRFEIENLKVDLL